MGDVRGYFLGPPRGTTSAAVIANKKLDSECLDMPSPSDSTFRKAIQQHVVEHAERDKALKMVRSPTASKPNSRRLDLWLASGHSWVRTSE